VSGAVVYLLRCGDGTLYCGSTSDLERRLREHASGTARGARYTRGRGPLVLAAAFPMPDLAAARSAEARVKRLRRAQKEALVERRRPLP
jgi:predicted GIY-YIG superfamily endonuclease